ncbi:MAG TPA: hypothetical protein VI197_26190 [Polyangiaceae bacterium]
MLAFACAPQQPPVRTASTTPATSEPNTAAVGAPEPLAENGEPPVASCSASPEGQRLWASRFQTTADNSVSDIRQDGSVSLTTDDAATTEFCFTASGEQTSPKDCELPPDPKWVKTPVEEVPEGAHHNYAETPDLLRPYLTEVSEYWDWYVPDEGGLVWSGGDFVQSLAPDKSVRWQTTLKSELTHASGRTLKPIASGGVLVLGDAYSGECTSPEGDHEFRRGLVAWLDERGKLLWHVTLKQCGWVPVEGWVRKDGSVVVQGWQIARSKPAPFTATIDQGRILATRAWDSTVDGFAFDADECLVALHFRSDPRGDQASVELRRYPP